MAPQLTAPPDPSAPRFCVEDSLQRRLATACATTPGPVHLIDLIDPRPTRQTLCHRESAKTCSVVQIRLDPCAECVGVALEQRVFIVREQNAAINLQRLPTAAS